MSRVTTKGQSVEEAVQRALEELGASQDQVEVTVLQEPTRGFLGLGAKPAVVEVTLLQDRREEALREAKRFLKQILPQMGVTQFQIESIQEEDHLLLNISGENLGIVIGRRGQTLDALQYLINVAVNRRLQGHVRFILDAANYRERRQKALEQLADRLAKQVIRTREKVVLEPMSAAERKIIHTKLQNYAGVMTKSEGEEPRRRITLLPK